MASELKLKKVICFDLTSERHKGQIWQQAMTSLWEYIYRTNCHMNDHGNLMPTNLRCTGVSMPPLRSIWPRCSVRSLRWASAPTLFCYTAKQMASQHKRFLCLRIHWENDESVRMWPAFKNIPACQCPCHPDQPSTWWRASMMCHLSLTSLWVMD